VQAEYGALQDNPELVSQSIVLASVTAQGLPRVRALYPYLASRGQWRSIAESDREIPHTKLQQALMAIHANLNLKNVEGAERIMKTALTQWPNDARLLGSLFALAQAKGSGSQWETALDRNLELNLGTLDADRLDRFMNVASRLGRPDLTWRCYARLRAMDPDDPALSMVAGRYAGLWFMYRRRALGLRGEQANDMIDLNAICVQTRALPPFRSFWNRVPLVEEMTDANPRSVGRFFVERCLEELARREASGALSLRMQMMFSRALAMLDRREEAHSKLDEVAAENPERKADILFEKAFLYDRARQWDELYELLRDYFASTQAPDVKAHVFMVNALMNLGFGASAMAVIESAATLYPEASEPRNVIAAIWAHFDFPEEALFALRRDAARADPGVLAQLLYDTGRFHEAQTVSRAYGVRLDRVALGERQRLVLTPAEYSIRRRWPVPQTDAEMAEEAERLSAAADETVSPFLRSLRTLSSEWYRKKGAAEASAPPFWRAAGRDASEQAAALNQLGNFLAWRQDYDRAAVSAKQAVDLMPRSAMLWRVLIALTEGARDVVAAARGACPNDPEIWLADIVTRVRQGSDEDWLDLDVRRVTKDEVYPVGSLVRAGDFLLREKRVGAASVLAREAVDRGEGLLSAYVLALRCALTRGDLKWALDMARKGADNAVDPSPFYRTLVTVRSFEGSKPGADTVAALEYLQQNFPSESEWAERLGQVYFYKKDPARVLKLLEPAMEKDVQAVRVDSLLMAAESARMEGNIRKAVTILERAHALHPERTSVLNNLVYYLAQDSATLPRARALLSSLLEKESESFAVLDTAAVVHARSGDLETAKVYMNKALATLENGQYAADEVGLNAAEILFLSGDYAGAKEQLEAVRRIPDRGEEVDREARELLQKVEAALLNE